MAEKSQLADELDAAEGLIASGELEYALELLERLASDAEEYVNSNCQTTDEDQWFSFPTPFELLAYRRIEADPRTLHDMGEPLDRLYADYALALTSDGDYAAATRALAQAVRWNPMGCGYRLDLGELYRVDGNMDEYLALSFSVFERASDVRHLIRAYCNFARYYASLGEAQKSAACLRAAQKFDFPDSVLDSLVSDAAGADNDPARLSDEEAAQLLAEDQIPFGANAEIAACLLICAMNAGAENDRNLATMLTVRARDLIGSNAVKALLQTIRETEAEANTDANA